MKKIFIIPFLISLVIISCVFSTGVLIPTLKDSSVVSLEKASDDIFPNSKITYMEIVHDFKFNFVEKWSNRLYFIIRNDKDQTVIGKFSLGFSCNEGKEPSLQGIYCNSKFIRIQIIMKEFPYEKLEEGYYLFRIHIFIESEKITTDISNISIIGDYEKEPNFLSLK